jgi:hypothetical protein
MKKQGKSGLLVCAILVGASGSALAMGQGSNPDLLESIERGMWNLRAVGSAAAASGSQLCVADPKQLVQIQHGAASCSHYVVRSTPNSVTISYSCKGSGQGYTTIKKETSRLLQIQSQGIHNSSPFSFSVEGRRAGAC